MIAADAAGRHDHRLRMQLEIADDLARAAFAALDVIRFQDRARDAVDDTIGEAKRIDAVAEAERQMAAGLGFAGAALERLDHTGAGAPADMKPRHRIAVAHRVVAAALGPADHRKNTVAHRPQPTALLAGGESHIGFRPAPWPEIFVAIEAGRAHPVLQRQLKTVLDAEPALFRRVHQKQSAERPESLAAKALFAFLLDHDDAFAGVGNFRCRNQARQSAADDDYVCIIRHCRPHPVRE